MIVAFKRLFRYLRADDDSIARMRREIKVQTSICNQNIMPILDYSQSFYWYTMPIAKEILSKQSTPIESSILIQVVEECANGLITAHERGCIHRDLTPNNILLISEGGNERWVVSDWGLVRRHGQTTIVRTAPGQMIGTAGFAAPEMWGDAHNVDTRADVYSLGRVVAWCLTGQWPISNLPLLPEGIWYEFVSITTALDPRQRPQDMYGVLELLKKIKR